MRIKSLILLLFFLPCFMYAQVTVSGKVIGVDGKPPAMAHVHLKYFDQNLRNVIKSVQVSKDGSFTISADEIGAYFLLFTGANHDNLQVPLIVEGKMEPMIVNVRLKALVYKQNFDTVKVTGDWNNFSFANPEPMTKLEDGTFVFEKETDADTLAYQLIGIVSFIRSVNGPQWDYLVYDGAGDYRSVVKVHNGKAKIIFDQDKLMRIPSDQNIARVNFKNNEIHNNLFTIYNLVNEKGKDFQEDLSAYRAKGGDIKEYKYNWQPVIDFLKGKMNSSEPLLVRQFAGCELVSLLRYRADIDTVDMKVAWELLPLESPLWGINNNIMMMANPNREMALKLMEQLKDKNPVKNVRANALANLALFADLKGEKEKVKAYYNELKDKYSDVKDVEFVLKRLNPDKKIQIGRPVPDFEVQLLDSEEKISNKTLQGKYYLLDFWATWCGPCVAEMENLHKAHEKFKDKVLFISLSLDAKKEDIAKFRADKWKMPWKHAFLNEEPNKKVIETFEVIAIPKPLLVNPQGIIIATERQLRGENLMETLSQLVK